MRTRRRWTVLAIFAGVGLLGFVAPLIKFGGPSLELRFLLAFGGQLGAFGVALWAASRDYRQRWPAAVAVICVAPLAWFVVTTLVAYPSIVLHMGFLALIFLIDLIGAVGTAICAIVILVLPMPPPPPAPIAPARIV